jgi:hypothetical protein
MASFATTDSRPGVFVGVWDLCRLLRDNRLASVRVRPASLRAGFFLLLVQEKETKEKDTPKRPGQPAPAR